MSETQFQQGVEELSRRLSNAGLHILKRVEHFEKHSVFFEIGSPANNTDFMVGREFLEDLQNTKDYLKRLNEYISAVAGRHRCGSPEHFYCSSGTAIRVSVRRSIQSAIYENQVTTFILLTTTDLKTGCYLKNSINLGFSIGGRTIFDIVAAATNIIRTAIDQGELEFADPTTYLEVWKRIESNRIPEDHTREHFFKGEIIRAACETKAKLVLVLRGDAHTEALKAKLDPAGYETKTNHDLVIVKNWK